MSSQLRASASSLIGSPSITIRSLKRTRCGLVSRPVRRPCARRRLSMIRLVRGLAVRPGDVDDRVRALRVAEQLDGAAGRRRAGGCGAPSPIAREQRLVDARRRPRGSRRRRSSTLPSAAVDRRGDRPAFAKSPGRIGEAASADALHVFRGMRRSAAARRPATSERRASPPRCRRRRASPIARGVVVVRERRGRAGCGR